MFKWLHSSNDTVWVDRFIDRVGLLAVVRCQDATISIVVLGFKPWYSTVHAHETKNHAWICSGSAKYSTAESGVYEPREASNDYYTR